ncbi:hypothetical protein V6N12_046069 [Hibiscus sabdariffa]|uniref:Uncharacterized protein n=1 Tax=Hibiscus sabdariffa TaxID=183260 RepID=A0ABR2G4W4_9ROSI
MQVDEVPSEKEVAGSKTKATYASKVAGVVRDSDYGDNDHGIQSEEIVVLDDDYVIDREGPFPSIKFSEKVHDQIEQSTNSEACDNVESIYGPYMVVDNSRHRQDLVAHNSSNGFTRGKAISGSRFASLVVDGTDAELPSATSKNGDIKMLQ